MAQILDELIIKLGLDSSGFKRDAASTQTAVAQTGNVARREGRALEEVLIKTHGETTKRMRQVEEVGKSAAQGFTRLKNEVVGLLGAIAGAYGLQQFVRNVTATNTATGYLAQSMNVSAKELDTWQQAGKRVGASAEEIGGSMRGLSDEMQNFAKTGQSDMIPALRKLETMEGRSVALLDANRKPRPVLDVLKGFGDRFSKMPLPEALSIGRDLHMSEGMVRLLSMKPDNLEKLLADMERLGVLSDADVKASVELQKAWDGLQQSAINLGTKILTHLTPRITAALDAMTDWVVESKKWLPKEIEDRLDEFGEVLKRVAAQIKSVVDFMGGWENATIALFGLWIAAKVTPIVGLIVTLATAMSGLATATLAVDTAAGGAGIRLLLGAGAAAGLAYGANTLLEKLEEMVYGKEFMDKDAEFRDKHSPIRDFIKRQLGMGGDKPRDFSPTADLTMSPEKKTLLDALSIGESSGDYTAKNPGSSAHGRYQFIDSTDAEVSAKTGLPGQDPVSQDKKGWYLAATTYQKNTGRDLEADVKAGGHESQIAAGLRGVWPSLPGGTQQNTTPEQWQQRLGAARSANALPRIPPVGPTFGPQMAPTSAIDPGMRFALRPSAASSIDNSRANTSSSEMHIGAITVNTAATDAEGIAKGIGGALRKNAPVFQANYGLA